MPGDEDSRGKSNAGYKRIIGISAGVSAVLIAIAAAILMMPSMDQSSNETSGQQNIIQGNDSGSSGISESSYGSYNSEHVHAAFIIKLDGMQIDFTQDKYQLKSRFIHVENNDGTTLHRHATGVPFGDFLKSVKMDIRNGCFIADEGTQYCDSAGKSLKAYVNSLETDADSLIDYIIKDNDRILLLYGDENQEEIVRELLNLQQTTIITTGNSG